MARVTTKQAVANPTVTASKRKTLQGIRLPDGSLLVGVMFYSDITTVLGFVIQGKAGEITIETKDDFARKVRISDYVDAYGRCVPRKLREFQARTGMQLPLSRIYSNTKTKVDLDASKVTAKQLQELLCHGNCFVPMPDYAIISHAYRRKVGRSYPRDEGMLMFSMRLHYPSVARKRRVKTEAGEKLVAYRTQARNVDITLPVYDAYSLPFEVRKYAVKRVASKTSLGAATPLYNYYVAIKKESLENTLPVKDEASPRKGYTAEELSLGLLDPLETAEKYNPGADGDFCEPTVIDDKMIELFKKNGVFIKAGEQGTPVTALKGEFTTTDLFSLFDEGEDVVPQGNVVNEAEPSDAADTKGASDEETVGSMPESEEMSEDESSSGVSSIEDDAADISVDPSAVGAILDGIYFEDKVKMTSDGDITSNTSAGVALPEELKTNSTLDENNAKVLKAAWEKWNGLCTKLQEVADAVCDDVPYNYNGEDEQQLKYPKAFENFKDICYEDKDERRAVITFGGAKKGPKHALLTLKSINLTVYRKFYASLMPGVDRLPVNSDLTVKTLTLYSFNGKPKGMSGFGITLPSGEHFTSSTIHECLGEISKLMHSLSDDMVQSGCAASFLNAGLAAVWSHSLKSKRRELGLNETAVAKSVSMEKRLRDHIATMDATKGDPDSQEQLFNMLTGIAFGDNKIESFEGDVLPYDPVTSEFRGGKHSTTSERSIADNIVRAMRDIENAGTDGYKASTSKSVVAMVESLKKHEGGSDSDAEARLEWLAGVAADQTCADLKNRVETTAGFDWNAYKAVKKAALLRRATYKYGEGEKESEEKPDVDTTANYDLFFDMHLSDADVASMEYSGEALAEDDPKLVAANAKLDANVKSMVLWLLGTVGVGENTNDGLQFDSKDAEMPGMWKDTSRKAREGAATRTRNFEYVANSRSGSFTYNASLKQPTK